MRQEVSRDDKEIAAALCEALAKRIGRQRFDLWFGVRVELRVAAATLTVAVADQFSLDCLRSTFGNELADIARQQIGADCRVEFRVDAALAQVQASNEQPEQKAQPSGERAKSSTEKNHSRRSFASLATFVVGDGNRLAHAAAKTMLNRLGAVTPLFVYGPTGCGKSHLLEGVWSTARRQQRSLRTVLLSAEQFTTYFLAALHGSGLPSFRRKYRDADLLLIDDVHFFAGKRATLVELLHTVDALVREGRQIVMTADRPPAELSALGSDLTARMAAGLVCEIEPLDRPTRLGTLRQINSTGQANIPDDALDLLADRLSGDARMLQGAVNRLRATSEALGQPITVRLAEAALADVFQTSLRVVRIADIQQAVCDVCGIAPRGAYLVVQREISQPFANAGDVAGP